MQIALVLLLAILTRPQLTTADQCGSVNRESAAAVREEVDRVFNKSLDAMQNTLPSGVRTTTWIPPDDAVAGEIRCFGPLAVPGIAEILKSNKRSFGPLLAVRMLGWAGGPEIVPILGRVLSASKESEVALKIEALESLTAAPPDKALPLVRAVLVSETDPSVLKQAASVQSRLTALTPP